MWSDGRWQIAWQNVFTKGGACRFDCHDCLAPYVYINGQYDDERIFG